MGFLEKFKKNIEKFFIFSFLVIILLNAFYFLRVLEKDFLNWTTTNLCSIASLIVIIGFLFKNRIILNSAVPLLLFFAIGGLFLMGWDNFMRIYSQVHHILMILSAFYILFESYRVKAFKEMKIGLVIGLILVFILGDISSDSSF